MLRKKLSVILSGFLIIALLCGFLICKKQSFSESENRYLAAWPALSWESFVDGSYFDGVSDYLSDHFPLRGFWISLNTAYRRATMKDEVSSVYFCRDDYLIEKYTKMTRPDLIYKSINIFAEDNPTVKIQLMLVPTSITFNEDKMPENAPRGEQLVDYETITSHLKCDVIDVFSALKGVSEPFYRLDHHWTTEAAYAAYTAFCAANNLTCHVASDYSIQTVTEDFTGTIYNKTNAFRVKPDCIITYMLSGGNYSIVYDGETHDSFYEPARLDTNDKYAYFMDSNHPLVIITNNDFSAEGHLLIIKDSYANCFVPFVADHYKTVTMVDPRYYGLSIHDYIEANGVDQVLFLYNMNTIGDDVGIRGIE